MPRGESTIAHSRQRRISGLDPSADLMGTGNHHASPPVVLNGGMLLVRNTQWARGFFALWWHTRCGSHDQLPLPMALFAWWSVELGPGCLQYDPQIMSGPYPDVKDPRHQYPWQRLVALEGQLDKLGGRFTRDSKVLLSPLSLPHVTILPYTATQTPTGTLLPFTSDYYGETLPVACHTKRKQVERPLRWWPWLRLLLVKGPHWMMFKAPSCKWKHICDRWKCEIMRA